MTTRPTTLHGPNLDRTARNGGAEPCPDCGAGPGAPHVDEHCTRVHCTCRRQWITCTSHNAEAAAWCVTCDRFVPYADHPNDEQARHGDLTVIVHADDET